MKILVLGSEGFIGTHCVHYLSLKEHTVYGTDLYEQPSQKYQYTKVSRLSPELDELFAANNFDAVINAAGSGNVPYSMTHPLMDFESNSLDTIRVLDSIRKYQPSCKYIHLSSAAVYGNPARLPISEEDRLKPLSPYGWHKLISENLCAEYSSVFNLRIGIARPFSVYGPGLKKQMFWDIYQKIKNATGPIELFGTGNESRDYIYIDDLIQAIDCIVHNGAMQGEVYNIASGNETTTREAIHVFVGLLNKNVHFEFNGVVRQGDPVNWRADVSKLKRLGFKPQVELDKGISQLVSWIINY